jgi:hypothetical protein
MSTPSVPPRRPTVRAPAQPPRARRRPILQWRAISPTDPATPADLERAAVAVLVGLLEWTAFVGVDFGAALAKAQRTEAQRVYGTKV